MIEVSIFIEGKHKTRSWRNEVPRIGETIVLDCNDIVEVVEVSHDWADPCLVQINCVSKEVEEAEG